MSAITCTCGHHRAAHHALRGAESRRPEDWGLCMIANCPCQSYTSQGHLPRIEVYMEAAAVAAIKRHARALGLRHSEWCRMTLLRALQREDGR